MSDTSKKQNFLYGTAMLAMATAIVKIIGAIYKIPLNAIIGKQGFSYYSTAYEIYNVLLMISTAGLPVAMSRMISQASSLGHYNQVRRIFSTARTLFLGLGITGSLLMTLFCRQLAAFQNQPDAWAAIGCLGPCVLLICVMSTFRGFFQGQRNMLPTSVSQVIEAVVKLIVGMAAAVAILYFTKSVSLAAGGAILGVTISCLVSSMYLYGRFRNNFAQMPESKETADSFGRTAKRLLAIAIPITIGSAGLQILTMMETKIYMGQLLGLGYSQMEADSMKGIYNMSQTIYNMPCAFGLAALAGPVTSLLGGYSGDDLALSTALMSIMGFNIMFNAVVLLTNAMMQAHGHAVVPVINMFISGFLRLIVVYILTGNPNIGIVGTPIGAMLCFLCITILNVVSMRRVLENPPAIVKNLLRPFLAAAIMGVLVYGTRLGLTTLGISSRLILVGIPMAIGVAAYGIGAIGLKAITKSDCMLLPKGEKIAKILHL